ncbi:MAG TPA: PQQ-binding-like beta-propeller repeat protein, partial [Treponemataceae bacterium]|nr:PQQ-binding-like beta-propeller repeat protein [Treponemataceae bacterium]
MKKNKICIVAVFFLLGSIAYSKNTSKAFSTPDWQTVLAGNVIAPPHKTPWGFVSITEGKILSAFTDSGKVIWQKTIQDTPSAYSVNNKDYIYIISDNQQKLSLYNPNGVFLWEKTLPEQACTNPLSGRDGRVFVAAKNSLSCYGLQGICKWHITLAPVHPHFPLLELNDGSLLRIEKQTINNYSCAKRISPYGTILEEIIFSGQITNAAESEEGVLCIFSNGTIGCLAVHDKQAISKWTLTVEDLAPQGFIPTKIVVGKNTFCILFSTQYTAYICSYQLDTHTKIWENYFTGFKKNDKNVCSYNNGRYDFFSGSKTISYSEKNGKKLWEKILHIPSTATYCMLSTSGYLLCTGDNWTLSGYRLYQDFTQENLANKIIKTTYIDFPVPKTDEYISLLTLAEKFKKGNYGEKELVYKQFLEQEKKTLFKDFYP